MGQRERTAEDRADNINRLTIMIGGVMDDAKRDGHTLRTPCLIELLTTLEALDDLLDELREAKLARAKLELKRAQP